MAEDLHITTGNKTEQYQSLIPQIKGLLDGEPDLIANLANVVAALKEQFNWLWVGSYLVKPTYADNHSSASFGMSEASAGKNDELVVGPFQGPVACTRIRKGRGVCGTSWAKVETIIVPDVEKFPGDIACSSLSKSEIVVPVIRNNEVVAVLDVDSKEYDEFDETDKEYLEQVVDLIRF
jgi:L-methionine (R)-S-oxide reductase